MEYQKTDSEILQQRKKEYQFNRKFLRALGFPLWQQLCGREPKLIVELDDIARALVELNPMYKGMEQIFAKDVIDTDYQVDTDKFYRFKQIYTSDETQKYIIERFDPWEEDLK